MPNLINQGCKVADIYHRYDEIHGALFGASYLRLLADKLRGKPRPGYRKFLLSLSGLQDELDTIESEIKDPETNTPVTGADRELRQALLEYTRYLKLAINGLENICEKLEQDETAYRALRQDDGRSSFTADKLDYDHLLSELERLGTRMDRLFSNY